MASQQLLLGVGSGVKEGLYIDTLYKQKMFEGTNSSQNIDNGLDYTDGDGMLIVKGIDGNYSHQVVDTIRGASKVLKTDGADAEDTQSTRITALGSSGFNVGTNSGVNHDNDRFMSYGFKEAEGFFDVVQYTGSGSPKTVSHGLGCKPGMIWIKQLNNSVEWAVYHHSLSATHYMKLDVNAGRTDSDTRFNDTEPTESVFTVGDDNSVNQTGQTYIAYLWGFGSSPTYAGNFGTGKQLKIASNSNLQMSTSSFCIECFFKCTDFSTNPVICDTRDGNSSNDGIVIYIASNGKPAVYNSGSGNMCGAGAALSTDTWYHIAVTRDSTTIKLYIDGNLHNGSGTLSNNNLADQVLKIGDLWEGDNTQTFTGQISNFRYTKGTKRYLQKFGAPTAPLNMDGDTFLLCLNKSLPLLTWKNSFGSLEQVHGSTSVSMSYETSVGYQGGNKFGKDGKQSLVAIGEYRGNGQTAYTNHPEINIGWEPEFVMVKQTDSTDGWHYRDTARILNDDGTADVQMRWDTTGGNEAGKSAHHPQPYGFSVDSSNAEYNLSSKRYVYFAIRRPDGWVGTSVTNSNASKFFDVSLGESDSGTYSYKAGFKCGFVPDMQIRRQWNTSQHWHTGTRITGRHYMNLSESIAEADTSGSMWDYPDGMGSWSANLSGHLAWQWRRHAGFDISLYVGTGSSTNPCIIQHGLGVKPEMVWFKKRNEADPWIVYHSGLGGGTNPETYILKLNYDQTQNSGMSGFSYDDRRITLTTTWDQVNDVNINHIAYLFASVDGVCKCGHFSGSDSTTSINFGFQPKFLIIKNITTAADWSVFQKTSVTDMGSGNDNYYVLNSDATGYTGQDYGAFTSTGVDLTGNISATNNSGDTYIYYAHA